MAGHLTFLQLIILSLALAAAVLIVINMIRTVRERKAKNLLNLVVRKRYAYWQKRKPKWTHKLIMKQLRNEFVPELKKRSLI